jgi:SAM-dependent methyltransferase
MPPKMSSVGDNYILKGKSDHDRLRVISEIHDDQTRELLVRAGLASGSRFVEFGCGLGYVTRWAAAMGAHAVGIDVNEEQVTACRDLARSAGLTNANFRTANIYEPGIEDGTLDISYCRWLMVHLNRPVDAMRAIYKALKPGGMMVCEEADVSAVYAEPRSSAYEEILEITLKAGRVRGADYSGGRRAHLWAKEAGFQVVHVAAYHPHFIDGPHKGFWNWTLRNAVQRLVEEGTLPEASLRDLVSGMTEADNSPDTVVAHCRMHQLIARKPAN